MVDAAGDDDGEGYYQNTAADATCYGGDVACGPETGIVLNIVIADTDYSDGRVGSGNSDHHGVAGDRSVGWIVQGSRAGRWGIRSCNIATATDGFVVSIDVAPISSGAAECQAIDARLVVGGKTCARLSYVLSVYIPIFWGLSIGVNLR